MTEINIDSIDSYDNYGAKQSANAGGDPIVLKAYFEMLYRNELQKATGVNTRRQQKIDELSVKNAGLNTHNENLKKNIDACENSIGNVRKQILNIQTEKEKAEKAKQDEINKKEIELEELKSGKKPSGIIIGLGEKLQYYITAIIEFGFTLYLWLFYTSVIYGAFMMDATKTVIGGIQDGIFSLTIFNPNALTDTWKSYGFIGTFFLVIAPFFVYALGLLIHKFQAKKEYVKAIGVYLVTLLLDALMAYAIVRNIHNANFNAGITQEPWHWKFAFQDTDFYIIIIAGFAAYIVWGFILTYLISEYDNIVPARVEIKRIETEIKQLIAEKAVLATEFITRVSEKEQEIKELEKQIDDLRTQRQNNDTAISANEEDINNLKK